MERTILVDSKNLTFKQTKLFRATRQDARDSFDRYFWTLTPKLSCGRGQGPAVQTIKLIIDLPCVNPA
jgi:hypothetical protein